MKLTIEVPKPPEGFEYTGEYKPGPHHPGGVANCGFLPMRPKKRRVLKFIERADSPRGVRLEEELYYGLSPAYGSPQIFFKSAGSPLQGNDIYIFDLVEEWE